MNSVESRPKYYYYKQIIDSKEEVIKLKKCFINLGKRIEIPSEDHISSDEEFKYFGFNSGTESYDSDLNGFHQIVNEYNRQMANKSDEQMADKPKTKKLTKRRSNPKRLKKTHEKEVEIKMETESNEDKVADPEEDNVMNICEQTLLEDDFYETNMQFFMSQSLPMTQSSALIQQNGRFAYYHSKQNKDESLKERQNIDHLLIPLTDMIDESDCWPLVLKTMTEYMFAFKRSSKYSKYLAHKVLAHYNWSEDKSDIDGEELTLIKRLHNQFLGTFMREILLNCYSRDSIMEVISGSDVETNAWTFISKLITFLINESIGKSDALLIGFSHLKHIVKLIVDDFQQFLSESDDYCVDIQRIEKQKNYRPLICRLIWSQKSPNYLNSVLKQLIFLITKVIKIRDDSLLTELFKLFEVSLECFRIGSGNARPYTSFSFERPTPVTELFQQLTYQSLNNNEVFDKLLRVSNICWVKVQLCGHFMTTFIVNLRNRYLKEKHRRISLKLIVECLTNATILSKTVVKPPITQPLSASKSRASSLRSESSRRRSSIGLTNNNKMNATKEWSKKNKYGENALHTACIKGQTDKLREILQQSLQGFGPDPNDTDNAGYTPLCEAAINCRIDCIRALVEWQSESNKTLDFESGPGKQTALHDSIETNAIECAKLIIESGGLELLNIGRDFDGKTPKDLIKSQEMRQMIDLVSNSITSKSFSPKIRINSEEDSKLFIEIIIDLIINYIETTKIDSFLDNSESNDSSVAQEMWPTIFFEVFQRDINESDITSLIEDLAVLRKLPQIIENLKTQFNGLALQLIADLEFTLSLLVI